MTFVRHGKYAASTQNSEGGNAVTLTLLGLAIAILAGVAVLYIVGKQRPVPVPVTTPNVVEEVPQTSPDPRAGWSTYEDAPYQFSFEYPQGWIVATGTVYGVPVITVYAAGQSLDASSTLGAHGLDTRVSFYPQGYPMGGQGDEEVGSALVLDEIDADVTEHVLAESGRSWATLVRVSDAPPSWSEAGYLYARAAIQDEQMRYLRGEEEIAAADFDVYAGDRMVRAGFVDPTIREREDEILRSFRFTHMDADPFADLLRITSPSEGAVIESPLTITGEARGSWYFEGSFPITLVTDAGEELATVPAIAADNWMTEDFVPFSVSLSFETTSATSGALVFKRDNPSGLSEHDVSRTLPVRFVAAE